MSEACRIHESDDLDALRKLQTNPAFNAVVERYELVVKRLEDRLFQNSTSDEETVRLKHTIVQLRKESHPREILERLVKGSYKEAVSR